MNSLFGRLFFVGLMLSCNALVEISRRDKHGMLRPPPLPSTDVELPPDHWFTQVLDHFQPTDSRTWKQRYQVVKDYYVEGGPVFLQIGGEGEASPEWMVGGAWVDYAKKYNALIFQVEHRYYGKSHPTSDLSVENLKFLSSEQALADLAQFIVAMNAQHKLPANTKWVAFGGSYAGNLAAWVRYKYPHLVHASVSSSAPVLAKLDFSEYMDVVKSSLGTYSSECVEAVADANKQVNILLKDPIGRKFITKEFNLCDPIDVKNKNDVTNLLESLADPFAGAVQYNSGINTLCDIMVNETLGTPVMRYAAVNSFQPCLDYSYDNMIKEFQNTTWNDGVGGRPWIYQICSEFGFFQSSEDKEALFGEDFPVDFFVQQCRDIFGKEFTKEFLARAVNRSNTFYGGLNLKATRVVYVHGSLDPWHALGITKTRIPQSPAIYINGTAHCANMKSPEENDPPALKAARENISSLIGQWLQEP